MGFEALILERCRAKGCPRRKMWVPGDGGLPPNPPSLTPVPGWRGRGASPSLPLASWAEPLPWMEKPRALKQSWDATRASPLQDGDNYLLLLTSPSRVTCQMLRMQSLCPVCVT